MAYAIDLKLIKKLRSNKKLTLQDMADNLGLKSKSDYFKRENGDTKFKSTEMPILAKVLGVPITKFFKLKVDKIETK